MGKFSSNAASALDKVLKRKTLVQIRGTVDALTRDIEQKQSETGSIEQEARRILDIEYDVGGSEIIDRGTLESTLVRNLDEDGLTRALGVATSVYNLIHAERQAWLADNKKRWEAGRQTKHLRYVEDVKHGPGVNIPPVGRKS